MQEPMEMIFGPYQIQRHLAKGGMANVYLAHNVETETKPLVAIKLVHTSTGDNCKRFRREIKELCALHHDHILPALAYGEQNSWCYLVTPYIEGGTLTQRLNYGPLSLEEATEIFSQIADALQYAHEQGIVHRDIKSSNVLLRDKYHVYLADFGLVKHVGFNTSLTISSYIIGTPEYMAPELAEEDASPRSDIYALGILLYQMLTGYVPFKGNSPLQVYLKHIQEQPTKPSVLNPAIPYEIERVVLRALTKNPDRRYQTVQSFNAAYQRALAQVNARQLKRADTALVLMSTTIRILKVKRRAQLSSNKLQQQKATLPRNRKQIQGSVVLVATLTLLMLSLLSISGQNAPQTSQVQLLVRAVVQIVPDKASPTPIPTPTPIATPQHNGESPGGNGISNTVSTQSYGNSYVQDNSKGKEPETKKKDDSSSKEQDK
jgi:serine/threonine protein kinase